MPEQNLFENKNNEIRSQFFCSKLRDFNCCFCYFQLNGKIIFRAFCVQKIKIVGFNFVRVANASSSMNLFGLNLFVWSAQLLLVIQVAIEHRLNEMFEFGALFVRYQDGKWSHISSNEDTGYPHTLYSAIHQYSCTSRLLYAQ